VRKFFSILGIVGALSMGAFSNNAEALSMSPIPTASDVTLVMQGCGIGFHRGPYGGCRPNGGAYYGGGVPYYGGGYRGGAVYRGGVYRGGGAVYRGGAYRGGGAVYRGGAYRGGAVRGGAYRGGGVHRR
jgi:hypothetical protein